MKLITFLLILFSFNCFSEKINEFTVDITFISDAGNQDIMNFGDKLTYRNTKGTASWKDSLGDYGIIKCLGNYLSSEKLGTNLNLYCQGSNKDGDIFWLTMKRNSKDYDGGIGKSEYVYGDGKFKNLVGTKCIYAVEISKEFSILKKKCKTIN
tara:strand:- start:179 stop:637 length:459 start_codon:yes stop_codon:yes gene_type:complete